MPKQNKLGEILVPFNCPVFGRSDVAPPTNIHDVRIPYIDIVGAIGKK
jgi:hypothetical protein